MFRRLMSAALALGVAAVAGAQTLKVGDPAPRLAVAQWVKGEPVAGFEKGRVYVVEFWATWCGPCIRGMPHVSELQKKYERDGVRVIGVNIWEDPKNVEPFMKERGDKLMEYTVAVEQKDDPKDVRRGVMAKEWMAAADQDSIPSAFIVGGDGKIAWIGHPMWMDEPLAKAVEQAKAMGGVQAQVEPAQRPFALMVGDPAPALDVAQWVKGEPVTGFEKGRVYVVEFWATWCGPCIASMPHLTEVQKRFKNQGVRVIGVTSEDPMNTLEAVKRMVAEKGDEGMGYTVAWDNGQKTSEAFMKQAGQRVIPTAFIVDRQGRIAWIGHPMAMDEPLERIVANEWDIEHAAAEYLASRKAEIEADRAASLIEEGKFDEAVEALVSVAQSNPAVAGSAAANGYLGLLRGGSAERAYSFARAVIEKTALGKDAMFLNTVAWFIVDPADHPATQDLDLALLAAERAYKITGGDDAAVTDTLAAVYFERGDVKNALRFQREACEKAKGTPLEQELNDRLKVYEQASRGG